MKKSRRDFLKTSSSLALLSGMGPLFSACSHFDDWLMGETRNDSDKVVILGAGLAGLAAAYELKKNHIPFRIFEGSPRYGGRLWTLKSLNVSSQYADIGGEKIEVDHTAIQALARELKVELAEVTPDLAYNWYSHGKMLADREWKTKTQALTQLFWKVSNEAYGSTPQILNYQSREQFPKAVLMDKMSVAELLVRLNSEMDANQKNFLEQLVRYEWGAEPAQISALHLVHWMRDSLRASVGKSYRVSGGTTVLIQALFDRVAGVLPERVIKFGHRLTAVRSSEGGVRLVFANSSGEVEIKAQKVICTLPGNLLTQVDGWQEIEMSPHVKNRLSQQSLGSHSKVIAGFKDRFWRNQSQLSRGGIWLTDLGSQGISQTGVPQSEFLSSLHGILQSQQGGLAAEQVGPHSVQQFLKDLQKINPKAVGFEDVEHVQNWKRSAWSQGSRGFLKPGQFQLLNPSPENFSWMFAGDTAGGFSFGTMNGAVQSAIESVKKLVKT